MTRFLLAVFILILPRCAILGATLHVSPQGDGGDGMSWQSAFPNVGDAILAAASGDSLWIQQGTYFESIELEDGLSLYGGFAGTESPDDFSLRDPNQNVTTLDASGTGSRVISIVGKRDILLDGLEITGGGGVNRGAGVYMEDATLTKVFNCTIRDNKASGEGFALGGGFYAERSHLILNDATITRNEADDGCGVYLFGATAEISHTIIAQNRGRRLGGFGIFGGGVFASRSPITVDNCLIDNNSDVADGGGILLNICNAIIKNSTISRNRANKGAGIDSLANVDQEVLISNCVIDGNLADDMLSGGGGINSRGPIMILDCTITNNVGGNRGGGILSEAGPTLIRECLIEGNSSRRGGGLSIDTSSTGTHLYKCTIKNNTAERQGGGIATSGNHLIIEGCVIMGNATLDDAGRGGGGIFSFDLELVKGCVISGNQANGFGGGISASGRANLENCLIYGNTARFRGGGFSTVYFEPLIENCVFANNQADMPGNEIYVALTLAREKVEPLFRNCIVWNDDAEDLIFEFNGANPLFRYCDVRGGWPGEGNIDADPLFVDPENGDYRLSLNSPCIDSGSIEGPATDIDGNPRPVDVLGAGRDGTGAYDMGAYEFQLPDGDLNSNGSLDPFDLFLFQEDWMKETDASSPGFLPSQE